MVVMAIMWSGTCPGDSWKLMVQDMVPKKFLGSCRIQWIVIFVCQFHGKMSQFDLNKPWNKPQF